MSRPKRPRSHVLASESFRAFEDLIRSTWVVRQVESDYGIDVEVEIFENDEATGLTFKVQLKGTDATGQAQNKRRIAWSTLAYWRDLDVPVLICLYSSQSGVTRARWAHTDIEATAQKFQTATTTVTFSDHHTMGPDSWLELQETVAAVREWRRQETPFPIPVKVQVAEDTGVDPHRLTLALRSAARPVNDLLKILGPNTQERAIDVRLAPGELATSLPYDIASFRLTTPNDYFTLPISTLAFDAILTISLALQAVGRNREAARLACLSFLESSNRPDAELSARITQMLFRSKEPKWALTLALPLLAAEDPMQWRSGNIILIAALAEQTALDGPSLQALWEGLETAAQGQEEHGDLTESATTRYNMSHVARVMRRDDLALQALEQAARLNPHYATRDYYQKELGGILFDLKRYNESAAAYARALKSGYERITLIPLLSDALLHAGKYRECRELLRDWKPLGGSLDRLCQLNLDISSLLCDEVCLDSQQRRALTTSQEERLESASEPEAIIQVMRESDALDPRIWITLSALQEPVRQAVSLTVAASREPKFPFFWAIAVLHAIVAGLDSEKIGYIIDHASYFNGDAFIAEMENVIDQQDPDIATRVRPVVYEWLSAREREPLPFTLRIH